MDEIAQTNVLLDSFLAALQWRPSRPEEDKLADDLAHNATYKVIERLVRFR